MARLSPSSNNSFPTTPHADPRSSQQQEQQDDDDDNPQSIGVAPSQQSPVSTSSEGYPSWLPKRPPPPAPGSTLHSLSTAMMFGSDGPPEQHPGGGGGPASAAAAAASGAASEDRQLHQTPVPFSGGRKPTPRSVRIVSM